MNKVRRIVVSAAAAAIMAIGCVGSVTASAATNNVKSNTYVAPATITSVVANKDFNTTKKTGTVTIATTWKLRATGRSSIGRNYIAPSSYKITIKGKNSNGKVLGTKTYNVSASSKSIITTNSGYKTYRVNMTYAAAQKAFGSLPAKVTVSVASITNQPRVNAAITSLKTVTVKQTYSGKTPAPTKAL